MEGLLSLLPAGSALHADGMLAIGGCRADDLAAEFGTPVLVVAEAALRARAREYAAELAARWPRSRVVFASKAFPCTAVQRVMVEEGLGLDVAGGGEIVDRAGGRRRPRAARPARQREDATRRSRMAVEHGIGLVVVDNADDVDRLEATVPAGRAQDVLVRVIPGVTADTHAHVLTGHAGSKFGLAPAAAAAADRPDRAQPAAAHAGPARARRLADPRRRAVRAVGGAARRARRVPRLRPRRRARRPLHVRRPAAHGRGLPRRAGRRRARAPARRRRS